MSDTTSTSDVALYRKLPPSAWMTAGIERPRNVWAVNVKKGGTSKTTLALLLVDSAMRFGLNVCCVDFDPQGDSSAVLRSQVKLKEAGATALGGKKLMIPTTNTVVEVIQADADGVVDEAFQIVDWPTYPQLPYARGGPLRPGKIGTIGVIPCYDAIEGYAENWTLGHMGRMARALNLPMDGESIPPNARWDIVIEDLPPGGGKISRMAVKAAHRALLVTTAEMFGIKAVNDTLKFLRDVKENWDHNTLDIAGLIFTSYNPKLSVAQTATTELAAAQGKGHAEVDVPVWSPSLPVRQVIPHSQTCRAGVSPFLAEARWRKAATEICQMADAVLLKMLDHMGHPQAAELRELWLNAWPADANPLMSPWVVGHNRKAD